MTESKNAATAKSGGNAMKKGLLVFAITFLANPCVNVFDYLPDFVGYLIIASALTFYAQRVPHFDEARTGFLRLACVSLAKIPSFYFMVLIRGQNTIDNDIKSLFTFSLTAIETIILVGAIKHLFDGFSYLGQRGCASALIKDFPLSKKGKRHSSPEALRVYCYVFAIYKFAATALPEMLLLTKTVDAGSYHKVFNVARLYPYTIILAVVSVFVMGIILTKRFSKFLGAIKAEGLMRESVKDLFDDLAQANLERKLKSQRLRTTLTLFLVAAFLTADINVDNLFGIDAIPNFVFGIFIILASIRLTEFVGNTKPIIISSALYSAVALVAYYFQVSFMTEYGYDMLTLKIVKSEYLSVILAYVVEFLFYCILFVILRSAIARLALSHTGLDLESPNYSKVDADYHKQIKTEIWLWFGLGILSGAAKLADVILRYFADSTLVAVENDVGVVTTGLIPWFGVVVFATTAAFILYSLYLFGKLKDEVELKYS